MQDLRLTPEEKEALEYFVFNAETREIMSVFTKMLRHYNERVLSCDLRDEKSLFIARAQYDGAHTFVKQIDSLIQEARRERK